MDILKVIFWLFVASMFILWVISRNKKKSSPSNTNLINCAVDPFIPEGWSVEKHLLGDEHYEFDSVKISLYQSEKQLEEEIGGNELLQKLSGKLVLNTNVLDHLLAHPDLIPAEWKGKSIFFFGTIYRHSSGSLYVRCLHWCGSQWGWHCRWLCFEFDSGDFSAVANP